MRRPAIRFVIRPSLLRHGIRKHNRDQWIYLARSPQGHRIGALVENTMMPCMINGPLLQQANIPAAFQLGISTQSQSVPFGTVFIRSPHVFERHHGSWACISSQRTVLREDSSTKSKKWPHAELTFYCSSGTIKARDWQDASFAPSRDSISV